MIKLHMNEHGDSFLLANIMKRCSNHGGANYYKEDNRNNSHPVRRTRILSKLVATETKTKSPTVLNKVVRGTMMHYYRTEREREEKGGGENDNQDD